MNEQDLLKLLKYKHKSSMNKGWVFPINQHNKLQISHLAPVMRLFMDRQTLNYVFSLPNPKQYIGRTRYDTDFCVSFLLHQRRCSIDHRWSADMVIVIYLSWSEMIIFFGSKFSDFCQRYWLFRMMEWAAILA